MRNLLIFLVLLLPTILKAQDKVANYISKFKDIAINEMHRSGIPASITLAQGMFESGYGLSTTALNFNNHFGIKCKKDWSGSFFFKEDDDYDEEGNLIASCFRAYDSAQESYADHTDFLVERPRYAELFSYARTDYHNWALGLQRCGYATNPTYAERLIEIIDRYQLWHFDGHELVTIIEATEIDAETNLQAVATDGISDPQLINGSSEMEMLLDSVQILKVVAIDEPNKNRINQAIILPANFKRRTSSIAIPGDFK